MSSHRMVGFGYKTGWLAIREGKLPDVLELLNGRIVDVVGWQEGVGRAYNEPDIVAATPLLPGADGAVWLLVAGRWVLTSYEAIDVAALSAALGSEVQRFATHRVSDVHSWERAIGGVLVRSFQYESADVTHWHGAPDEIELAVGLPATYDIESDPGFVNESDLMRVAGAWSLDPTTLDDRLAPAPLTLAQLPFDPSAVLLGYEPVVVEVTDLFLSAKSEKVLNRKIARRIRKAGRRQRRAGSGSSE